MTVGSMPALETPRSRRSHKSESQVAHETAEFERVRPLVESHWLREGATSEEAGRIARHVASQVTRTRTPSKCELLDALVEHHGRTAGTWTEFWVIGTSGRAEAKDE
jgi:hypothetical protein